MKVIRVVDWHKHFETSESRKRSGALSWVSMPTKQDGRRFRRLSRHKHAHAVLGAWLLIVEVAARCPNRGVLVDDRGDPLDAGELEALTGFPIGGFRLAIAYLSSGEMGWLEVLDLPVSAGVCRSLPERDESPGLQDSTGQDSNRTVTGHNKTNSTDRNNRTKKTTSTTTTDNLPTPQDPIVCALFDAGLRNEGAINRLRKLDGISVSRIMVVSQRVQDRDIPEDERPGLVSVMLKARDWYLRPFKSSQDAVKSFRAGMWTTVNGVSVEGRQVGWNSSGLHLDGELFLPESLIRESKFL